MLKVVGPPRSRVHHRRKPIQARNAAEFTAKKQAVEHRARAAPDRLLYTAANDDEAARMSRTVYLRTLCAAYAALWIALAIAPLHRFDWLLENALVLLTILALVATYRAFPLSRVSYTFIFLFLALHTLGAHYTYAEVPYDDWFRALTGEPLSERLGWSRNNYDRVVHFSYGLLLAYPVRELVLRVADVRGFWGYFLPLDFTMSTSMLYELIEWAAAELFGGDLGMAFLGTQGDVWDAHKDMALASLGAAIAMTATAAVNLYLDKDLARDWVDDLRARRGRSSTP